MPTSARAGSADSTWTAAHDGRGSPFGAWANPAPQAKASEATMMPPAFCLSRCSPSLPIPTTSFAKDPATLITRPPQLFRSDAVTIARGRARVNVVSHTRGGWERHRRAVHAAVPRAVVARVAEISPARIITHGTAAPEVSQFGRGLRRLCPRTRGAHWGGRAPHLSLKAMFARLTRRRNWLRLLAAAAAVLALALVAAGWRSAYAPRVWRPGEAAVAFWSWRAEAP